jgi:hypothetical protein
VYQEDAVRHGKESIAGRHVLQNVQADILVSLSAYGMPKVSRENKTFPSHNRPFAFNFFSLIKIHSIILASRVRPAMNQFSSGTMIR